MASGGCFRLVEACVGVPERDVGVLARVVGIPVFDVLPLARDRFRADGELERVDGGLEESVGVLRFRTDRGSFELVGWFAPADACW